MPRLTKLYTRTGDEGTTALGTRKRVSKDDARIVAYGTVDELNSLIGWAIAQGLTEQLSESLPAIQNQLFHLGAELSFPPEGEDQIEVPRVERDHIDTLESLIDELNEALGPLQNFILPGGSPGAAALQVARAVCRRAERELVALARRETVRVEALAFLNRLSDALFVMARFENHKAGIPEPLWDSHA